MPSIGPLELVIVLVVALVILGPKRLPAAARSVGAGMRELKSSLDPRAARDERPRAVAERDDRDDPA